MESSFYQLSDRGFPSTFHGSTGTSPSYELHSPINIDGNLEFINQARAEDWPGEGTPSSPYIITGFNITAGSTVDLIVIRNTDVVFNIINCSLEAGRFGIHFRSINNVSISDNALSNNGVGGINIRGSENSIISGNTVTNTGGDGIFLENSENSTVSNNIFTNNSRVGISLKRARNSTISGNILNDNSWDGIALDSSSNITISNNTITNNNGYGISQWFGGNSTISNNIITNNSGEGIFLYSSDDSLIIWNELIGNNPTGTSQAFDDGLFNTFAYNYWDDWQEPDSDMNGFVDKPYSIAGSASNQDEFPRTSLMEDPLDRSLEHIIPSSILIILIIVVLAGSIRIQKRT